MSRLDPTAGDTAEPTRHPAPPALPGDHVNPNIAPTIDTGQITGQVAGQITEPCLCHDVAACPDQATLTVSARELARVGQLLSELDEFLRSDHSVTEVLADFYARRGDCRPRFAAANLIDAVGFTALGLGLRHVGTAVDQQGDEEGADR
jgi:hypothetical protein